MTQPEILDLPKQATDIPNHRRATAPYNFVPLPETVVPAVESPEDLPGHDVYYAGENDTYKHTGYFDVTLITKSAVYVRCPLDTRQFKLQELNKDCDGGDISQDTPIAKLIKNTPDFFYTRYPRQPVIPGSTLRGMLRAVVEIVAYGKITSVTDRRLFYRTVDGSLGQQYRSRLMRSLTPKRHPTNNDQLRVFGVKVRGGFIRQLEDGTRAIEECDVGRVDLSNSAVQSALSITDIPDLYDLPRGDPQDPNQTPKWTFQYKDVWVTLESEAHHFRQAQVVTDASGRQRERHGDLYLRFRKASRFALTPGGNLKQGMLVLTGAMQHKHFAFVFVPRQNPPIINIPNDPADKDANKRLWERFHDDDQLTAWQRRAFPSRRSGSNDGYLQPGDPVFFLTEPNPTSTDSGDLAFFGRAQLFRVPYQNRPIDFVPEELRDPRVVDYAEGLFGFVRNSEDLKKITPRPRQGDSARAYAGRVHVTDARLLSASQGGPFVDTDAWTPQILSNPKPTSFQHYLVQPNASDRALRHYDSADGQETAIRGFKRYWHQGDRSTNPSMEPKLSLSAGEYSGTSTQHTVFKPLKSGVQFKFRIYFENLSDTELGVLCWALHPVGDHRVMSDPAGGYCHSLGMGKSLGMGAVKLSAALHLTRRDVRYMSLFSEDRWASGIDIQGGEDLGDVSTLERKVGPFQEEILSRLRPEPPCSRLADMLRVSALLRMMEFPNRNRWNTVRETLTKWMTVEDFRRRKVLPAATEDYFRCTMTPSDASEPTRSRNGVTQQDDTHDIPEPDVDAARHSVVAEMPQWDGNALSTWFGKDYNKLRTLFAENGEGWRSFLSELEKVHGERLRAWEGSQSINERKASQRFAKWLQEISGPEVPL